MNLTFSLDEHEALQHAAQAHKMPLAAFVKQLCLDAQADRNAPLPPEIEEQLAERMRLLHSIANNFNQIARRSNTIGYVRDEQMPLMHLHSLEKEFTEALRAVRQGQDFSPSDDFQEHR